MLIADGHHRIYAATLPHSPVKSLSLWISSLQLAVTSFSLIVTFNDHFSWSELNQILTQHDIIRCHSDEADYQLDWQNHSDYYQYHQPTKNSYQIQHHIRTTFKHIPQLSDLRPIMPADLKRSPTQVNQLTVTICPPKLTDIINAVQRGLYFPEKSTCFSHKTSAKVLEYLTQ